MSANLVAVFFVAGGLFAAGVLAAAWRRDVSSALAGVPLILAGAGVAFVGVARFAGAGAPHLFGQEVAVLLAVAATALLALGLGIAGSLLTLLLTILVAFGLAKRSTPYVADFKWFSMPIAFNGPSNFQTFSIDLVFRADHLTILALLVIEVIFIAAIGWHQLMGRNEPGAARFHAVLTLLLFACVGILVRGPAGV